MFILSSALESLSKLILVFVLLCGLALADDPCIAHKFVSLKADSGDATIIRPSNWNACLNLTGGTTGNLFYRDSGATNGATWLGLGTVTSVLHGNAAGAPTFGAVSLTADVSGILPTANGGTANAFFTVAGPATSAKTFTFPNASASVLTDNAAITVAQGGTGIASGTSGGIPYYSGSTTLASSGALMASALLLGGGAGASPTSLGSLGTTTTLLHGNAAGAPSFGAASLTADVTGTLPVANGGTGITSFGTGVATFLGTPSSANLLAAVTGATGTGAAVFGTSPTFTTSILLPNGSVGTPSLSFSSWPTTGFLTLNNTFIGVAFQGVGRIAFGKSSGGAISVDSAGQYGFSASTYDAGTDVNLFRDGAGILALRTGTAAQALNIYNTFTSSTVGEYATGDWKTTANLFRLMTVKGSGGGTARGMALGTDSTDRINISATGGVTFQKTITAAGTTGAQTINQASGSVNFAAAATSVVVTNSLVDTNSIVLAVLRTNDATCQLKNVVPASGSFTILMTAACGAETSVGFVVH